MNLPSNDDVLGISRERYQATLSDLSELRRDNARLKADNARLRAALEAVEWVSLPDPQDKYDWCPACCEYEARYGEASKHAPDCTTGKALNRPECEGTGELTECKEEK